MYLPYRLQTYFTYNRDKPGRKSNREQLQRFLPLAGLCGQQRGGDEGRLYGAGLGSTQRVRPAVMAPKKKGGAGKKDAKKAGGDADGELTPQELLRRAAFRIESLERQLAWREEKMAAALASQKELKERVALYHEDFEREKASIFDIASDMTRQYKGMQASRRTNRRELRCWGPHVCSPALCANRVRWDGHSRSLLVVLLSQEDMLARINSLEKSVQEQKDALELSRMQLEEERRDKAQELAHKDAEMADLRQKMEDMALEFGESTDAVFLRPFFTRCLCYIHNLVLIYHPISSPSVLIRGHAQRDA